MDETVKRLQSLYEAHGVALVRYLRRMSGGSQSSEDLLQEVFVRAVRSAARLNEVVSAQAWLFTIARNVAFTARRRYRPTRVLPEQLAGPSVAQEDPRLGRMRQAMADLPEKQRIVLEYRIRDGLSYEEIAVVLSIPVGTVRSRLHHAMRQLRGRLLPGD